MRRLSSDDIAWARDTWILDHEAGCIFWRRTQTNSTKPGERAGTLNTRYRGVRVRGVRYPEHRVVWAMLYGHDPGLLDHVDGEPLNNSVANLRPASDAQNAWNTRPHRDSRTGTKGVHLSPSGYVAKIYRHGKSWYLGTFATLLEAAAAYDRAATETSGHFAWCNLLGARK